MGANYVRTVSPKCTSTPVWSARSSEWNQNSHDINTEVQQHLTTCPQTKDMEICSRLRPFCTGFCRGALEFGRAGQFICNGICLHQLVVWIFIQVPVSYAETCTWYREWKDTFFRFHLGLFHVDSWWELLRYGTSDANTYAWKMLVCGWIR
jgi:hypothetical protein